MATQTLQSIITATLNKGDKGDFVKGDKGEVGVTGTTGTTGDKGAKGDTGNKGDLGDKGSPGDLTAVTGIAESFTSLSGATGTVTHNTALGDIFYHSDITSDFTANFTNVATTDSRSRVLVLVLIQGSTAYMPTAIQINGTSQSIRWAGGSAPVGTISAVNIVSFSVIRSAGTWLVLAHSSVF